jgi:hypothetical protein
MRYRRLSAIGWLALVVLLLGGCDLFSVPEEKEPGTPEYQPLTAPRNLVENIAWCYEQRDAERYSWLLDDDFTFYLDPGDVYEHGLPQSWGYETEVEQTERMFETADGLTLDLYFEDDYSGPGSAEEEWPVDGVDYHLLLRLEDTTYQADGQANFFTLRHDQWYGAPRWWILSWWDHRN